MATPPPPQPPPPPPPPPAGYPPRPPAARPPEPAGPVERSQIRPHRAWYWVAGAIAALTIAGAILIFTGGDEDLGSLTDVFGTLEEFQAPGETTVELEAGAEWAIYRLSSDASGDAAIGNSAFSDLDCRVRDPGGGLVPLVTDLGFTNVTLGDSVYVTSFTFDVPRSGSYDVGCEPGSRTSEPVDLVVGEKVEIGEIFGFFGRAAAGIAVLLLGLLVASAIALPVWLSRSRKIGQARRGGALRG